MAVILGEKLLFTLQGASQYEEAFFLDNSFLFWRIRLC